MNVCGIDPGDPFGWGIVEVPGDHVVAGGQAPRDKRDREMARMSKCGGTLSAVEDQFIIDDQRMPIAKRRALQASTLVLAHDAGEWHMWLSLQGWTPCYVPPSTWRAPFMRGARGWTKQRAVEIARAVFGIEIADSQHHFAEALLIARWRGIEALHRARTGNLFE